MIERPAKGAVQLDSVVQQISRKCQQFKKENLAKIKQVKDGCVWEVDIDKITASVSKAKNVVFLREVQDLYQLTDEARQVAQSLTLSEEDQLHLKNYWEFYQYWLSEYLQAGLLEIIVSNVKQLQKYMDEAETAEHNDFYQ